MQTPLRFGSAGLLLLLLPAGLLRGQDPAPPPKPPPPPPPPADTRPLLDRLNADELQEAIKLLRSFYVSPGETDDRALARATVTGLLTRLDRGALLVPAAKAAPPPGPPPREELPGELRAETFPSRLGYLRLGAINKDRLGDFDKALKGFATAGLPALVLDLRATAAGNNAEAFELAAEILRRFVPKGRPLFTLRKPPPAAGGGAADRLFTANADPIFPGRVLVVTDADTAGAAEVIAAVLKTERGATVVGAPTAGQAVEYADFGLGGEGGAILRLAVAQVVLPPDDRALFPAGVRPDLPAGQPRAQKLEIFRQSVANGAAGSMAPFVFDAERPHFSEAALVARENPELDAARDAQARRREGQPPPKPPPRDVPLQRAVDVALAVDAMVTEAKR